MHPPRALYSLKNAYFYLFDRYRYDQWYFYLKKSHSIYISMSELSEIYETEEIITISKLKVINLKKPLLA